MEGYPGTSKVGAVLWRCAQDLLPKRDADLRVQGRQRLVEQEDLGLERQRARQGEERAGGVVGIGHAAGQVGPRPAAGRGAKVAHGFTGLWLAT